VLEATQPIEIIYEQVVEVYTPIGLPHLVGYVFQEIGNTFHGQTDVLIYGDGLFGMRDPAMHQSIEDQLPPNGFDHFFRWNDSPETSFANVQSWHLQSWFTGSEESNALYSLLFAAGFHIASWRHSTPVTVGFDFFPNTRLAEFHSLVYSVDPSATIEIRPNCLEGHDLTVVQEEWKQYRPQYASVFDFLQAHQNHDPPCFASLEAYKVYEVYRAAATTSGPTANPPNGCYGTWQ